MRTSEQAAHIILRAIQDDNFLPGSYLDSMGKAHDLQDFRVKHLPVHLEAYPAVKTLPFVRPPGIDIFSFELWNFKEKSLINSASGQSVPVPTHLVTARLWDVTAQIVDSWERENSGLESETGTD